MNSRQSAQENTRIHAMTDDQFMQYMHDQGEVAAQERNAEIGG